MHVKLNTGEPFYVGKGKDNRAFIKRNRSIHWRNIVNKYGYDIIFIKENLTEKESFIQESYWIKRIGRKDTEEGPLVNFTNGGEGASGRPMNKRTKDILLGLNTGRPATIKQKQIVGLRYKNKFGKDHNRSISLIINGVEFSGYSEASRKLNILITTLHYRVKSENKKWMHFQIKK